MTGPHLPTPAQLQAIEQQYEKAPRTTATKHFLWLLASVAWLLGVVKGQQEQLALHEKIGETYGELHNELYALDLQNAGSQQTVSQLTAAFNEIDERGDWSGRFGSPDMNTLCERYRAARVRANDFDHLERLSRGGEANR